MQREIFLSRDEAELLVDLLENNFITGLFEPSGVGADLAVNLRKDFGMMPQPKLEPQNSIEARRGAVGIYSPTEQDKIWFAACDQVKRSNCAANTDRLMGLHAAFLKEIAEATGKEMKWRRRFLTLAGMLAAGFIVATFLLFR